MDHKHVQRSSTGLGQLGAVNEERKLGTPCYALCAPQVVCWVFASGLSVERGFGLGGCGRLRLPQESLDAGRGMCQTNSGQQPCSC